jgi:hypothetical protein
MALELLGRLEDAKTLFLMAVDGACSWPTPSFNIMPSLTVAWV